MERDHENWLLICHLRITVRIWKHFEFKFYNFKSKTVQYALCLCINLRSLTLPSYLPQPSCLFLSSAIVSSQLVLKTFDDFFRAFLRFFRKWFLQSVITSRALKSLEIVKYLNQEDNLQMKSNLFDLEVSMEKNNLDLSIFLIDLYID